jgi:hypothetical protein
VIPVLIHAADGYVTIWHTEEEYEALWRGVDPEVAAAMDGFNERAR